MIVKARHKSEFLQINNETIQDSGLSWAARGLLAYLLSLPDNWEPHLRDLITRSAVDGRRRTEAALNELIQAGYVVKEQGENKRKDTKYTVYETL
jgi:DNA-binding MarR family transcriptional regulator